MKTYYCWLPNLGETRVSKKPFWAIGPVAAAEQAAARKCRDDLEWQDHLVAVQAEGRPSEMRFDVTVATQPHFTATKVSG